MGRSDAARDGRRTQAARARVPARALGWACALIVASALALGGCAGRAPESAAPYYHEVAPGENLYRIGLRYGVPAAEIARVNGIRDVTELRVGQLLLIPGLRGKDVAPSHRTPRYAGPLHFTWPVKGRLTSRFGLRGNRPHEGIDLGAPHGTPIYAAEAGRVIHSGRFGAYGKVVILKHAGAYRSVYAHARRLFVEKGEFVERGQKIAEVGATGRATGPHLHFEIRRGETAHDPLVYLP